MRKLLIVIVSLLALPLVYIGVLHLLPDEELSPQAAAWLENDGVVPNKEENSHYLLLGIEAPAGSSIREYGEARIEKIVQVESEGLQHDLYDDELYLPDGFDHDAQIEAVGMGGLCELSEGNCLDAYHSDVEVLLTQGDNALLLERYRELSSLQHYQSVAPIGLYTPFPRYHLLIGAQRLRLASIGSLFLDGGRSEALDELAADLRYARMLMVEADTLIVRMVAIKMMANDLHLYSQLLDQADGGAVIQAVAAIAPLSESERDFVGIFSGEFRFQASLFGQMVDIPMGELTGSGEWALDYLLGLLPIRQNRMLNIVHAHSAKVIELSGLPPSRLEARFEQVTEELIMTPGPGDYLYDPVGSVLLGIAVSDYSDYLLQHHNLDGLIRLVRLKGIIRAESVPAEGLDKYIAASAYASAYLQEDIPIRWDPEEQTLHYTPVNETGNQYINRIFLNRYEE